MLRVLQLVAVLSVLFAALIAPLPWSSRVTLNLLAIVLAASGAQSLWWRNHLARSGAVRFQFGLVGVVLIAVGIIFSASTAL
jgi:hypothetical protein